MFGSSYESKLDLVFYNCQGITDREFKRTFKVLTNTNKGIIFELILKSNIFGTGDEENQKY